MTEISKVKIFIGYSIGILLISITSILYFLGDTEFLTRFMVYTEAYIASVIAWLGFTKYKEGSPDITTNEDPLAEVLRQIEDEESVS